MGSTMYPSTMQKGLRARGKCGFCFSTLILFCRMSLSVRRGCGYEVSSTSLESRVEPSQSEFSHKQPMLDMIGLEILRFSDSLLD